MGNKSLQKKQYIIETAKKVFVEKGFRSVTMKDIVDACDISRGGLYLYFNSTEEIFKAVLENEMADSNSKISEDINENPSCNHILTLFFVEQKKEILEKKNSLLPAMYEYSFYQKEIKLENKLENTLIASQCHSTIAFLNAILKKGNQNGEFKVEDTIKTSKHFVCVIEGLRILSRVDNIDEKMINDEFVQLMREILNLKKESKKAGNKELKKEGGKETAQENK